MPANPPKPAARSVEDALAEAILQLLHQRGPGKTICPSEAARLVAGGGELSNDRATWEPLMPMARAVAQWLAAEDSIVITQRGQPVDAPAVKGPIRLRLR